MIDRLLALRTVARDGRSAHGFVWPLEIGAIAEAPDWDANPGRDCGGGLHGLPYGHGAGGLLDWESNALWMVVEVDLAAGCVGSADKCRFRRCTVLHVGDRYSAAMALSAAGAVGHIGGTATAGDGGTATAGDRGTATAGYRGTATAGDGGTATAGYRGTATAGDGGTATAGYRGTATAGDRGTATAGDGGTATAGYGGAITIEWHDGSRWRRLVGEVGTGGLKAGTAYRVEGGKFVEVTE